MFAASVLASCETTSFQPALTTAPHNFYPTGKSEAVKDAANDNAGADVGSLSGLVGFASAVGHSLTSWIWAKCNDPDVVQAAPETVTDSSFCPMQMFEMPFVLNIFAPLVDQENMVPA
ncbi:MULTISPECIES: hypothetical protein [Mesorhizobium]|uniref:Uncharacterized protein n=1 Tax=Mesorhizobium denitrificans TaxID=2294114 RepID=A0A371XE11_9HYPH|nr:MULTISPECIES: hypothetical protein [Mesorhizobium]RFC67470.1 hypothetical protein DY251_10740 [Mesorhizobium denitrificans]